MLNIEIKLFIQRNSIKNNHHVIFEVIFGACHSLTLFVLRETRVPAFFILALFSFFKRFVVYNSIYLKYYK